MVKLVLLGLWFSFVGLSPVCVADKTMASFLLILEAAELGMEWRIIAEQPVLLYITCLECW